MKIRLSYLFLMLTTCLLISCDGYHRKVEIAEDKHIGLFRKSDQGLPYKYYKQNELVALSLEDRIRMDDIEEFRLDYKDKEPVAVSIKLKEAGKELLKKWTSGENQEIICLVVDRKIVMSARAEEPITTGFLQATFSDLELYQKIADYLEGKTTALEEDILDVKSLL